MDPVLLKIEAENIATSLPLQWKQAYVTQLLKSGDPFDTNNYRPISNQSFSKGFGDLHV